MRAASACDKKGRPFKLYIFRFFSYNTHLRRYRSLNRLQTATRCLWIQNCVVHKYEYKPSSTGGRKLLGTFSLVLWILKIGKNSFFTGCPYSSENQSTLLCKLIFSTFSQLHPMSLSFDVIHCVPRTTVSFQKHAACLKIDRFSKNFHWMITDALTFVSKS